MRRRENEVERPAELPPEPTPLEQQELRELLLTALHALPVAECEALLLCHMAGLSQQQASETLGMTLNTLKSHSKRGLERLRRKLEPQASNLEAYLASVAFVPPADGWATASARWREGAESGVSTAGASLVPALSLIVGLIIAATLFAVWYSLDSPTLIVADSTAAELVPETPAPASADDQPLEDDRDSIVATQIPGAAEDEELAEAAPAALSRTPPSSHPLGRTTSTSGSAGGVNSRVRTTFYASGAVYMRWNELLTESGPVFEGPFQKFYLSGSIWESCEFRGGLRNGPWLNYHENGELSCSGFFEAGLPSARWTWFFDSGEKMAEGDFQAGAKVGEWMAWHKTGAQQFVEHYVLGKRDGPAQHFDESGQLTRQVDWRNGVKVSERHAGQPDTPGTGE